MVESLEGFLPSRTEFIQVITVLIQYGDVHIHGQRIHRFFESLIPYMSRPPEVARWQETDFDNFRFVIHELFLYTLAILLQYDKLEAATLLLSQPYYVADNAERGRDPSVGYGVLRQSMQSLEIRNRRLGLHRLSVRADLLESRSKISGIAFRNIMQADFICYLRAELTSDMRWYPETLVFAGRQYAAFELFGRSKSRTYLARTLRLLGTDLANLRVKLDEFSAGKRTAPRFDGDSFSPAALLGADELGTRE